MTSTKKRKIDAPPPFVALETEKWVLGGCLLGADQAQQYRAEGLREVHFWRLCHRLVWRRVVQALDAGIPPDLTQVYALLAKHNEIEEVGVAYLASLIDGLPRTSLAGIQASARTLVENFVGRQALGTLQRAQAQILETPALVTEGFFTTMGADLTALSAQLAGRRLPDHVAHVSEVLRDVRESLLAGEPTFIDTPYPALNSMLGGGFAPGEYVILGGRPGTGKSAMALEIVRRAGKRGAASIIVSREMLSRAQGLRLIAQEGPVHATALRKRKLEAAQWRTIDGAIEALNTLPIFITDKVKDVEEIARIVRILADEGTLGLVVVDYLQLIDAPKSVKERRHQVEAVSRALNDLKLDFGVPVLALSSLTRPKEGHQPTLASLRESGQIEHDANTVILIHAPNELQAERVCIVPKSRDGRTGQVELFFRGEHLRFEEKYPEAS